MQKQKGFLLLCIFLLTVNYSFAASMGGGGMGGNGGGMGTCGWGPFPPCPVPLDTNVAGLLLAGGLYGAYKIYIITKKNRA